MKVEIIDINTEDGVVLNGFINKTGSDKIIISTHGMGSDCFKQRDRKILEEINKIGIDYLVYNTRGSYLMRTLKKKVDGKTEKILGGTAFEDVEDGYFDIKGAIQTAIDLGYKEIYLQGHSLGSTKTLYTYNKLKIENDYILKYIKGIILLSLVDVPRALQVYCEGDYENYKKYAESKEQEGKILEFMPPKAFIQPVSIKTYLKYVKYYENFDFARYHDKDYDFQELNNIDVPLFMRWGNVYEMIEQDAGQLAQMMNQKIKKQDKDINFINGSNHSYDGKEEVLAQQIVNFLKKI